MYQQIIEILKQNNIQFTNILWRDEFGKLQLNDNEDWVEYIEDQIDMGILFYFSTKEKTYFKYLRQINLGFTNVILLEEIKNENNSN